MLTIIILIIIRSATAVLFSRLIFAYAVHFETAKLVRRIHLHQVRICLSVPTGYLKFSSPPTSVLLSWGLFPRYCDTEIIAKLDGLLVSLFLWN